MKKVLILTTNTTHHIYFCQELRRKFRNIDFFVMQEAIKEYEVGGFEQDQIDYEAELWFDGYCEECLNSIKVDNVNKSASLDWIIALNPDLIVVYGTGRIGEDLIKRFKGRIVNLHGGDAEKYRGLDSHLWAVYHNDFNSFYVTLHHVNEKFDDGNVIRAHNIMLGREMELYQLRAETTKVCIDIISRFLQLENMPEGTPQSLLRWRYYSKMPEELIEDCKRKFDDYILKTFK